jgi:hypothetical protein
MSDVIDLKEVVMDNAEDSKLDPRWYKDKRLLQGAVQEFGSLAAAAREIGSPDGSTLAREWRKMGLEKLPSGPAPKTPETEAFNRLYARVYGN